MPRPNYKRPYQPKNRKQGGGIPKPEGRATDLRVSVGEHMNAMLSVLADQAECPDGSTGMSISAYCRNVLRQHLADLGIEFDEQPEVAQSVRYRMKAL